MERNARVRILYLNSPQYDYLTATLIEGLTELGHEVVCSRDSNYGKAIPAAGIPDYAETADLIVAGSNQGTGRLPLDGVRNPRIVAVDGSDLATFEIPAGIRFKAIFKRELCVADQSADPGRVYALPFAAEKRYFTAAVRKDLQVSFIANMATNPLRNSIHVRLLNRGDPAIFSGSTNERAYLPGKPRPNPIETPGYRSLLARSRISVNVPGLGYDCARYWEILAARAMLFTHTPDIMIPNGFTDGVNCVTFSSMREFEEKLDHYLTDPCHVGEIAEAGYQHVQAHHTTARRAAYFLDLAIPAANRPGFCDCGKLAPGVSNSVTDRSSNLAARPNRDLGRFIRSISSKLLARRRS